MARPVHDRSIHGDVAAAADAASRLKRRPVAGAWQIVYEEDDPQQATIEALWPGDSPIDPPPPLINGWKHGTRGDFKYRWTVDGGLQLSGWLDPTDAVSDTVCIVLPESYRLADATFLTDIEFGAGYVIARVIIDSTTGEITIQFPAETI